LDTSNTFKDVEMPTSGQGLFLGGEDKGVLSGKDKGVLSSEEEGDGNSGTLIHTDHHTTIDLHIKACSMLNMFPNQLRFCNIKC
jgi:hypothetical protein